jgi:methylmalonyl-CoA mutase C-terminal domain/subunit
MSSAIKVLMGKLGLDGHDRGVQVVAQALVDAGMEVIYTGLRQSPQSLVRVALEEDVDVIGVSSLSGAHLSLFTALINECQKENCSAKLFGGGIIPEEDEEALLKIGFSAIFTPGSSMQKIVQEVKIMVDDK